MLEKEINNLPKEKFVLVNENKKLHDKELVTKPIGFFKDAMHRFAKNKGSIVGAIVIGILVLYAIIAPIFSPYSVSYTDTRYSYMLPQIHDNENIDFLDGSKNVDTNFVTFVEHYSKGLESNINAIKRQEYTYNEKTDKYHYRLNSVRAVGTVFIKSITRADYYAIQRYQDKTGKQIIYPITDPDLRPTSQKNINNANYWYETKKDPNSTNDVPVNYEFREDGSLYLPNIYKKYTVPLMSSTDSSKRAVRAVLEAKDGGYALKYVAKAGTSYAGEKASEDTFVGYIGIYHKNDNTHVEMVNTFDEAATFVYDTTYQTLKTFIDGHSDPAQDDYYFFGLANERGSTANLLKEENLALNNGIPLKFYTEETGEPVDPVVGNEYYLAANRRIDSTMHFYINRFFSGVLQSKTSDASDIKFEEVTGGYIIKVAKDKRSQNYIKVTVDGNNNVISSVASTAPDEATIFTFDTTNKAFKVTLNGHTDASLDKDYYLGVDLTNRNEEETYSCGLIGVDEVSDSKHAFKPIISGDETRTIVDTIDVSKSYKLYARFGTATNNFFYVDGNFKGDNYFSKVRFEQKMGGINEYTYDYAIQKDGGQFEIRVNYYEYYCYYHSQVLKDNIKKPFFLFGTTALGQDLFTCLASGARFSFVLAITVASVNLIVGAIYGAIEGYYGGKTDMIMERIVEILNAVPFMIVITLLKYHMVKSPHVLILFIAFFLTGWIGMSGLVRMQFYRFKNQEYVLAARTLGARDWRIMFKHIFPNALGTIVTSCVLVIPSMIFSETSLSYLGIINLNSGNMTSVGTLLANAQGDIDKYPHTILYPAMFISLLMLCFNLFGNGLRDAFNPSLRGTED